MDSDKRRKLIIAQQLKLQELKSLQNSQQIQQRTPSKKKQYRTEQSQSYTLNKYPTMDMIQNVDDIMTHNDCKLIFLQPSLDVGFKTFSEMMRANSNWVKQAQKINPERSSPSLLQNRLHFNHTQATKFKEIVQKKWNLTVKEVSENIIQKQEQKHQPKIKLVQLKISHHDHQEDQQEEPLSPQAQPDIVHTNLKFFWFQLQISGWKPSIREGCTVTYLQNQNKCLMYGGIGNELFKTFVILSTSTWVWKDIGPGVGDVPQDGRFGHTATLYKQQLIIYGGEKKYNTAMKMRECYSDVRVFSLVDKNWLLIKTFGDIIEGRRNHIAENLGKFLFVYGGINSYGRILNDVSGLNLETSKWTNYAVENFSEFGVSDAASVALFRGEVKMENPYFSYEIAKKKTRFITKVTIEGIYVFGGKTQNGEATNDLRIIQFGTKPLKLTKAKTKGQAPLPRYSHSMNFSAQLNSLIIYGGRNDSNQKSNILNDIFVLQVEQMNWIQVLQVGQLKAGKCNHCSVSIDSKLLIFGGYTQNYFASADLQLIEIDQNKVSKMVKDNKGNKNKEVIIQSDELISNSNLKVFKTEYYNEAEDPDVRQKKILESEIQKLSYTNFRSFLPLPPQGQSSILQEFKYKREMAKLDQLRQPTQELSRRNSSRKTLSELKLQDISRQASKQQLNA